MPDLIDDSEDDLPVKVPPRKRDIVRASEVPPRKRTSEGSALQVRKRTPEVTPREVARTPEVTPREVARTPEVPPRLQRTVSIAPHRIPSLPVAEDTHDEEWLPEVSATVAAANVRTDRITQFYKNAEIAKPEGFRVPKKVKPNLRVDVPESALRAEVRASLAARGASLRVAPPPPVVSSPPPKVVRMALELPGVAGLGSPVYGSDAEESMENLLGYD